MDAHLSADLWKFHWTRPRSADLDDRRKKNLSKLDQISAKMDAPQHSAQTKKSEPKDFASFIKHKESIDKILELLHSWIDDSDKVKALVYLKAAIDANVITRPTYDAAKAEFPGRSGSKSLYYVYTGEPLAFTDQDDLEALEQAKREFKSLP